MHGVCDSSRIEHCRGSQAVRAEICGVSPTKNQSWNRPVTKKRIVKNSEENLEKDSPHVLLVFAWYEGLHCIRLAIVVQLVNMEKGFVWFPTIACLSKTCPTDSEFHSGALVSIATVAVRFYHKFLFVMVGDFQRYCPRWGIVERPQIMYMGSCPFAINKVFNNVDGLCLLHDLVGTLCRERSLSLLPTGGVKSAYEFTGYSVIAGSYSTSAWKSDFFCLSRATWSRMLCLLIQSFMWSDDAICCDGVVVSGG